MERTGATLRWRWLCAAAAGLAAIIVGCASPPAPRPAAPERTSIANASATIPVKSEAEAAAPRPAAEAEPPPGPEPERERNLTDALPPGPKVHVSPEGAGARDGSSPENAIAGSGAKGALQSAWDRVPAGGSLVVAAGEYHDQALTVREGGSSPDAMRWIVGEGPGGEAPHDAPGTKPVFRGTWRREDRGKGGAFLRIARGVKWLGVRGIRIEGYREGVYTSDKEGRNEGLRFVDLDVVGTRDALVLSGGATDSEPDTGTRDVIVSGCRFVHYTKRGMRIRGGCRDVFVSGCLADAGGRDWAIEVFPIGFSVMGPQGVPKGSSVRERDIVFVDCVARNSYNDAGEKYWNADGFCVEGGCERIAYYRCRSLDNTDGGWDDKSVRPLLVECVAIRNKRNFRFWGADGARLVRCASAFATKRGGSGGADGLWAKGRVHAERCTFHANPAAVSVDGDKARVELDRCVLAADASAGAGAGPVATDARVVLRDCVLLPGGADAGDPGFVDAPGRDWDGSGGGIESTAYGKTHGFLVEPGPAPGAPREEFLEFLARFR